MIGVSGSALVIAKEEMTRWLRFPFWIPPGPLVIELRVLLEHVEDTDEKATDSFQQSL